MIIGKITKNRTHHLRIMLGGPLGPPNCKGTWYFYGARDKWLSIKYYDVSQPFSPMIFSYNRL